MVKTCNNCLFSRVDHGLLCVHPKSLSELDGVPVISSAATMRDKDCGEIPIFWQPRICPTCNGEGLKSIGL